MANARVFCTYFDSRYESRGRVMADSLRAHGENGRLVVLALDDAALAAVESWPIDGVDVISRNALEERYPQLLQVQPNRARMEYVFTLTPWLTSFVMESQTDASWVTYLDADLCFFSPPEVVFDDMQGASVGIVAHRFTREQLWRQKYGIYNVAWVAFRNDIDGRKCLGWWGERCLEWCHDRVEDGRFADQGYLNHFRDVISTVRVVDHPGVDLAPWNLRAHSVSVDKNGELRVDGLPLVFFHFHGLRQEGRRFYFKHIPYLARTTRVIRESIYEPYCRALVAVEREGMAAKVEPLLRQVTVLARLRSGRQWAMRKLALMRGDYIDV
jgi:hypothetical protein